MSDYRSRELLAIEREVGIGLAEAAKKLLALGYSVDEAGDLLDAMCCENDHLADVWIDARDADGVHRPASATFECGHPLPSSFLLVGSTGWCGECDGYRRVIEELERDDDNLRGVIPGFFQEGLG